MNPIQKLSPFKRIPITIGALPTSYVDSLSYYETLVWLISYLEKTVIPALNTNADAIVEVQNKITELQDYVDNYFDNLDVQEEINNKLDDMAESGELTDIIAQYLSLAGVLAYDTVADMKAAENIANGSILTTLGYHSINDGGKGLYKVRNVLNTDVIDEGSLIALYDENLVAELVTNTCNVKIFGAYGDNTHDDTTAISNAIIYGRTNKMPVYIPKGKYIVTDNLPNLDAGSSIIGEDGFDGDGSYNSQIIDNRTINRSWLIQYYQVDPTNLLNERGTCIRNLAFINNDENLEDTKWLINFNYILENVLIENLYITGYERLFYANDTNDFIFRNIRCNKIGSYTDDATKYYAFSFEGLFGSLFDNIQIDRSRYMFKITTRSGSTLHSQTRFTNCHFEQHADFNCVSTSETESLIYINSGYEQTFENCMFVPADSGDYEANAPYMIYCNTLAKFTNCYFLGNATGHKQSKFIYGTATINNCTITNCATYRGIMLFNTAEVDNNIFNCYIDSDITDYRCLIYANVKSLPKATNNILNITTSLSKITKLPSLFLFSNDYTMTTSNSTYNKSANYSITNKWTNTFRIQKNYADFTMNRMYKIKAYDMVNGNTFYYEGIIKNDSGTLTKVSTTLSSGLSTYPIDVWYINDCIYIQFSRISNWLHIEVEDLDGTPIIAYMDNTGLDTTGHTSHLYIEN